MLIIMEFYEGSFDTNIDNEWGATQEEISSSIGTTNYHINKIIENDGKNFEIYMDFSVDNGSTDVVANQNSVLVRPFKKLIDEGKYLGNIKHIFYRNNEKNFSI